MSPDHLEKPEAKTKMTSANIPNMILRYIGVESND